MRIGAFVAVVAALVTLAPGTASAAPPPNDLYANATAVSALPFSHTLDTSQATVDSIDTAVETACGYSGLPLSSSVWYAVTLPADEYVTANFPSSADSPAEGVVTGTPSRFQPVLCQAGPGTFLARAGQTYYVDLVYLGGSGGTLDVSFTGQPAPPFLDQSFTGWGSGSAAIGFCCAYIGQTFTAGKTGLLTAVSVDIIGEPTTSYPLHVAIRDVDSSGLPGPTILDEVVLNSSSSPLTRPITFPQPIPVTAGTQYAIVANYQGAPPPGWQGLGVWSGGNGDPYPGGAMVSSFNGGSWYTDPSSGWDLRFETYVQTAPTSQAQCTHDRWRAFAQFTSESQCLGSARAPIPKWREHDKRRSHAHGKLRRHGHRGVRRWLSR